MRRCVWVSLSIVVATLISAVAVATIPGLCDARHDAAVGYGWMAAVAGLLWKTRGWAWAQ